MNDEIQNPFIIETGMSSEPLLFALVTHPMLSYLDKLAHDGQIVGLHLPDGSSVCRRFFYVLKS